ncbi:EH signature domain-containing protein [Bradyrhizobium sp. CB1717]|uniref:EH signature domain-containing protein n=1 Tax=Bradyrhizobium sp. CB1717 TaxID=3039154 RepID=UPI0024B129DE|nr:EH signature domain-containing protein [Bradyrhizobium sp. CB1717]WFU25122.1 EH signature domain-containing protein [Bradyrhizobium sp. CB1717]
MPTGKGGMASRLSSLSQRMRQINDTAFGGLTFDLRQLEREVGTLRKWLNDAEGTNAPPDDIIATAIRRFVGSPNDKVSFRDLQLITFGCLNGTGDTVPGLGDKKNLFHRLLDLVAKLRDRPRLLRRCYRGLLSSYFNYDFGDSTRFAPVKPQFESLQAFLLNEIGCLEGTAYVPDWIKTLRQHVNLLSNEPTKRYSTAETADAEFRSVCSQLDISKRSWIQNRYLIDRIEHAAKAPDDEFRAGLPHLLGLLQENGQVLNSGLRLILERYADCSERTQNLALSDFAVKFWGIPWLPSNSGRWFALSASARQMIVDWLKLEFIQQFFSVLAEDGTNDRRRLKFWRSYHDKIDDMYFALGRTAQASLSRDLAELRKKMTGRVLELLNGGSAHNNAFIMQIGRFTVVEFGAKGNACFVFEKDRAPFNLNQRSISGDRTELKSQDCLHRLLHVDGASEPWEGKFRGILSELIGSSSGTRRSSNDGRLRAAPSSTTQQSAPPLLSYSRGALEAFCKSRNIKVRDLTEVSGNLWVESHEAEGNVAQQLRTWGFQFRQSRGWWRKVS